MIDLLIYHYGQTEEGDITDNVCFCCDNAVDYIADSTS